MHPGVDSTMQISVTSSVESWQIQEQNSRESTIISAGQCHPGWIEHNQLHSFPNGRSNHSRLKVSCSRPSTVSNSCRSHRHLHRFRQSGVEVSCPQFLLCHHPLKCRAARTELLLLTGPHLAGSPVAEVCTVPDIS